MKKAVADYLRVAIANYNEAQNDKSKHLTFEEVKNSDKLVLLMNRKA